MTTGTKHSLDRSSLRPTRVRYGVVAFGVALAMVTYLDRVCISTLSEEITRDLAISDRQMSFVFSAFTLAYALFEIPTAWWASRLGTRLVLARIVVWWSAFTMATAGAFNFISMLITRFLFGMGEAGAWPCSAAAFSRWVPAKERGKIQGIFFAGAHLSGGLTPWLVLTLLPYVGWRAIFLLFGTVGFAWAAAWYWWYRDDPSEHPSVNEAELQEIVAGRRQEETHHANWAYWRRLFGHRNTWPLCLMYIGNAYSYYFCITWLPKYLKNEFGLTSSLGIFAGLPLILSVVADLFGGVTTDWLTRRFGLWIGRSGLGATAYFLAGVAMTLAAVSNHWAVSATLLSVSVMCAMFTLGASWGTCADIGGQHTGVVSATMNSAGSLAGIATPIVANELAMAFNWDAPIYLMGVLLFIGAVCWLLIDPRKRVFD